MAWSRPRQWRAEPESALNGNSILFRYAALETPETLL